MLPSLESGWEDGRRVKPRIQVIEIRDPNTTNAGYRPKATVLA